MNTRGSLLSSEMSITINCLCTLTWVAARPMPGASYMVSNMSSINARRASSTDSTGVATVRRRLSGYSRMVSRLMGVRNAVGCVGAYFTPCCEKRRFLGYIVGNN